jgi:hypothetical protein
LRSRLPWSGGGVPPRLSLVPSVHLPSPKQKNHTCRVAFVLCCCDFCLS